MSSKEISKEIINTLFFPNEQKKEEVKTEVEDKYGYFIEAVHFGNNKTYYWKVHNSLRDRIRSGSVVQVQCKDSTDIVKVKNLYKRKKFVHGEERVDTLKEVIDVLV